MKKSQDARRDAGRQALKKLGDNMKFKTITIVGLGLMGGSLAAACRRKFPRARVIGVSRNASALQFALRKKWIHEGTRDLAKAACISDLIILCTPVDSLEPLLAKINQYARRGTLVTDVGSVKGKISRAARRFKNVSFIGAHPMAGSHARGIEAAGPDLYTDHLTFITAPKSAPGYAAVKSFWKIISGKLAEVDPERHDEIVAQISHLPHTAASSLAMAPSQSALPFAAKGFLDSTRIAQGDASVWVPILLSNRKAVGRAFRLFERRFQELRRLVLKGDAAGLTRFLKAAAARRTPLKPA